MSLQANGSVQTQRKRAPVRGGGSGLGKRYYNFCHSGFTKEWQVNARGLNKIKPFFYPQKSLAISKISGRLRIEYFF